MIRWMLGLPLSWWICSGAMAQPAPPPPVVLGPPVAPRPSGLAIGIGVGYTFPTSLQTPNVTSVRLRLASGLTIEPTVVFAATSIHMPVGSNTQGELTLGSLVRYPLRARGAMTGGLVFDPQVAVMIHLYD